MTAGSNPLPVQITAHALLDPFAIRAFNALSSHFPEPLETTADGKHILFRTMTADKHYGLAVSETRSNSLVKDLVCQGDILQSQFSPDGTQVSFFLQSSNGPLRKLYLWDWRAEETRELPAPLSYAETHVAWSRDSLWLGYTEFANGLIVCNSSSSRCREVERRPVSMFDWGAKSGTLVFILESEPARARVISVQRPSDTARVYEAGAPITDARWRPGSSEFSLLTGMTPHQRLLTCSWESRACTTSGESTIPVRALMWSETGNQLLLEMESSRSREIGCFNSQHHTIEAITHLGGVNELRGIEKDGTVVFTHRGMAPVSLGLLDMASGITRTIAQGRTTVLPTLSLKSERLIPRGLAERVRIWDVKAAVRGAILRFHGQSAQELPVWQDDVAFAAKNGYYYVTIDYGDAANEPGKLDSGASGPYLLKGAVSILQSRLGIGPDRIVVLGYSAGAAEAVRSASQLPTPIHKLVLVGAGLDALRALRVSARAFEHTQVTAIDAKYDVNKEREWRDLRSSAQLRIKRLIVEDNHLLIHPTSWAIVNASLYQSP